MNVAAHLIVGARPEPFLPALLASLEGVADVVLVNDNSGDPTGPNARALAASTFARNGALIVDAAPFVNFADARNRVLALHREHAPDAWAAFVDADEVHRPLARTIARRLRDVPETIASIDGYTRHYIRSLDSYMSIERRMSFFRVTPDLRFERPVHEKLEGMRGDALVLPYVYDHYGWVTPLQNFAAKGRQYSGLGQSGKTLTDDEAAATSADEFFAPYLMKALRSFSPRPPALGALDPAVFADLEAMTAHSESIIRHIQSPATRLRNLTRRLGYDYRWRARWLDPHARRMLTDDRRAHPSTSSG